MSENTISLRSEWKIWRFDQMAKAINERADPTPDDSNLYVGLEHLDADSLRIRRWGSKADMIGTKFKMRKGDILFARRNAYLKRVAIAPHDGLFSAHGMVLRANEEVVLPEFLPFFMQSDIFMNRAVDISVGSLSPTINWKSLAIQNFMLPPREEQLRICKLLNEADELAESIYDALESLVQLKKSFSLHVFRNGLRGIPNIEAPVHFKVIPNNWKVMKLSQAFNILDNRRVPIKDSERSKRRGEYPYYGASGKIDYIDDFIFDEPIILLAEDGMNLVFRSSPLVYKVTERCWVNNHAHVLQPTDFANIDFYTEYLESISYDPFITGTYQKKITKSDCARIPLPLPPLVEQEEIADVFSSINTNISDLALRLTSAKNLLRSLRDSALRGCDVQ